MFDNLVRKFPSLKIKYNEPLAAYTFMKVGGNALAMVFPKTIEETTNLLVFCDEHSLPFFVLGKGANVIVNDDGVDRLIINTEFLQDVTVTDTFISAESGVELKNLSNIAQEHGLSGLEFSCGIPGTVGGAVYMNAGAYDGEMKDVVVSVLAYVSGEGVKEFSQEELKFEYRKSVFMTKNTFILETKFRLTPCDPIQIQEKIDDLMQRRRDKQPLEMPSSGSTFKRPEGYFAGKLITDAGLKGYRIGGAAVSEKHAGFLVNIGGATAQDLLDLITHVQSEVFAKFGVSLEPEVKFLLKDGTFKSFN